MDESGYDAVQASCPVVQKAGVAWQSPHTFRHTRATELELWYGEPAHAID